jgi:hypothetical protein
LRDQEPDPETVWTEAEPLVEKGRGLLIVDDSALDKPYARKIELVTRHWSGKHKKPVRGINVITTLWGDGDRKVPVDYRVYSKADGLPKHDHFWDMMLTAKGRGFSPKYVPFDTWYARVENLKPVRDLGWHWQTKLRGDRVVTPEDRISRPLDAVAVSSEGTVLHLRGYGLVEVFRIDVPDGDTEYWATNDLEIDRGTGQHNAEVSFAIENYHQEWKQFCGVAKNAWCARSGRGATASGWRSARSCAWKGISSPPGSVRLEPSCGWFGRRAPASGTRTDEAAEPMAVGPRASRRPARDHPQPLAVCDTCRVRGAAHDGLPCPGCGGTGVKVLP